MAKRMIQAKEAAELVAQAQRGERLAAPVTIPSIQRLILENTVYIFNVGPWARTVFMGSLGRKFIPGVAVGSPTAWEQNEKGRWVPCEYIEEGADLKESYAAMEPQPGIVREPLKVDESKRMRWSDEEEGTYVADQILGIGIGHSPQNSLKRIGCFRAKGPVPTEKELQDARDLLRITMLEYVKEARMYHANGPKYADFIQPETHHVSARWLNLEDEDWLVKRNPEQRNKCKGCGALVDPGIATCPNGHIMDAALYREFMAEQEALKGT
jgi:hypothetical protein